MTAGLPHHRSDAVLHVPGHTLISHRALLSNPGCGHAPGIAQLRIEFHPVMWLTGHLSVANQETQRGSWIAAQG